MTTAVQISPKIKCPSLFLKLLCPDVSSGLITKTFEALPETISEMALLIPKVDAEHPTIISYAKPSIPSSSCTSIAVAGYALCRLAAETITASMSLASTFAFFNACLAAITLTSAENDN